MALSRSMLKGMGLTEEQVSAIIEAHTETVDALKDQIKEQKDIADTVPGLRQQLADAQGGDDWKTKYEEEHSAFETYKTEQGNKAARETKAAAYKALLKEAGVREGSLDAVVKVTDLDSIELDEKGAIKDADTLKENVKTEWAGFITTTQTTGAKTQNPPETTGGKTYTSRSDIMAIKDRDERRKAIKENPELFGVAGEGE